MLKAGLLGVLPLMAALTPQPETQVFRSGTRLVEIEVVVRDKNGPLKNLTKDDFTVLDQGKPQPIAIFRSSATRQAIVSAPPPPGTVSNRQDSRGRPLEGATVVLLDQLNTRFDYKAYERAQVIKFLRALSETDRIALYSLGKDLHVLQDFTTDPKALIDAVSKLDRGLDLLPANLAGILQDYPPAGDVDCLNAKGGVSGIACAQLAVNAGIHDNITVEALKRIIRHLSGVPGRKNLVWVKESLQIPPIILAMAAQANVALYPVLIRTVVVGNALKGGGPDFMDTQHRVRDLAATTGGAGFGDAADLKTAVRTAEEDSESAYTLGFYPAEETLDGAFHRIVVKLSDKELSNKTVEVRYRPGYLATKSILPAAVPSLEELIETPLDATAIGLAARAEPDPQQPGSYRLRLTVDLRDVHLDREEGRLLGAIDLSFRLPGSQAIRTMTTRLDITEAQLAQALEQGYVVNVSGVNAGPGDIFVSVRDRATGAAGSLRIPLARQ
jgi:VWFA-related protein